MNLTAMMTRRSALLGLASLIPLPVCAQTAPRKQSTPEDVAVLERSAIFDINPQSGALKETIQKGQILLWRRRDGTGDHRFKITDISVALLRSETGGELKMTFAGKVSALGYLPADEVKLNVIVRSKGGAALHSWSFGIPIKCADKDQAINPMTQEVPKDFAANVFANANTVEVAELSEPSAPGTKVQRCSA